ncbi:MAG: hypothetical protein M1828_005564 [Chrysothrix sp. TS-e1954]|nr:MAG: hypothetical protein M1828_005564 [Chrysothrix sp. TS-e1954]
MALQAAYSRYLASPSAEALASDASIHYMPTLSSISNASAILRHLSTQEQLLKKKENFLNVIENERGLCIEAETTISFMNGGGTYLPGLDDNFLVDKTVTLPITHIVSFDRQNKIQQIRLLWDQASLLKMMDVVGSRGRNWPICDGKDQIRVLTSSIDAANRASSGSQETPSGRRHSRVGANGDQYTSLNLYQPRETRSSESYGQPTASRASTAKPAERDYHDLFAAGADLPRSPSPTKVNGTKGGAGKNYSSNRIFDQEPLDLNKSPAKKTDVMKYGHFEFGDTEHTPRPTSQKQNKHGSQWNFEDFVTPSKPSTKARDPNERQFGWSENEEEAAKPIVHRPYVPQARPSADTHFDFNDDATPMQQKSHRPSSSRAKNNMGLYEDHVTDTDDKRDQWPSNNSTTSSGAAAGEKMPLGNITNQSQSQTQPETQAQANHRKNFSSQFELADDSPSSGNGMKQRNENVPAAKLGKGATNEPLVGGRSENLPEAKKRSERTMQASWEMRDDSPGNRGINIKGDGMGSRKKAGERSWWEYDEL